MTVDYAQCDFCGAQVMHGDATNENKFPVVRRYQDQDSKTGLLAVRCAECAGLPYQLQEGEPYRIGLLGGDERDIGVKKSTYNYWPRGIGHLIEVYTKDPPADRLLALRSEPIEVGFWVEEDVNFIVVSYRRGQNTWNVIPYLWHQGDEWTRAIPPIDPASDAERGFRLAYVNTRGGKYLAVRSGVLALEFATIFHQAIQRQIDGGAPDAACYERMMHLPELVYENKVDSMLIARCAI